ncbi:glutathione hydrolase-like YwrD proenzyme isoform X2 [Mustelus asterias]
MPWIEMLRFSSRRSPVVCTRGCTATSQPLATDAGLDILKKGGNAADAAVAMAAVLSLTEPFSTGLGGDCNCMFYDGITKKVYGLNGSGRSPQALTLDLLKKEGFDDTNPLPLYHANLVTVPGAAAAWCDTIRLFGSKKELAQFGKKGFYEGRIARTIVEIIQQNGGVMNLDDLKEHTSTEVTPFFTDYKGLRIWELPPNGQGITALMALNMLENFNIRELGHNTADYIHLLSEAMKLSFADCFWFCADPAKVKVPVEELVSKHYSKQRSELINMQRTNSQPLHGNPCGGGSDTVYFTAVDAGGSACSFTNSNFSNFGTGLVPEGCGFALQNRGANFSLSSEHPNCLAPGKRPYHTIIPALATSAATGQLLCSYGVMGGFMQPQGHVQVLLNMLEFGMNPQEALDAPRFCVNYKKSDSTWKLSLEEGIHQSASQELIARGHNVHWPVSGHDRSLFGRGQIITKGAWWDLQLALTAEDGQEVLWAGSDPRADGCAIGF